MAGSVGKRTVWVLSLVSSRVSDGYWVWDTVAVSKSYVLGSVLASYCYLLWQLNRNDPSRAYAQVVGSQSGSEIANAPLPCI